MILRVSSFFSSANLCITAIIFGLACSPAWARTPVAFKYTGEVEIYVVPSCVAQIEVTLEGASGGGGNGGSGSTVSGIIDVVEGQVLEIRVGGEGSCPSAGYNGVNCL